ncbi:unnamed protein product [Didymodactylos carnosus]|uniref:Uncharacterized protein n=1 Tax=Didymodactylos carnosus TaxID=1234261 RepID=A0A813PBD3_9BILA|nr:unnamed protein product [Didymodactylos carnosus]CAF0750265.1 unnamed protein product [Didymodactylos carnosus]CAF3493017.1 unnamed protein product [Didymodactylos carnosus]CAF3529698.1 unnamed protein product [Didymodactylos carnosus]
MIARSTFLKIALSGIFFFGIGVVALNFISYSKRQDNFQPPDDANAHFSSKDRDMNQIKSDLESNNKPETKLGTIPEFSVNGRTIQLGQTKDQNVFVRDCGKSPYSVLLLHGQSFTSKNWKDIGTIQYLCSWGYKAIAVDLPGYGNSSLPVIEEKFVVQWFTKLIRTLRLSHTVVVSPSMSGRFTIPYIMDSEKSLKPILDGFVPISPVYTEKYSKTDFTHVTIPTLIVYGENDTKFQSAIDTLKLIPNNTLLTIKNASHACYIDRPNDFHNGLRQFLYSIYRPHMIQQKLNRRLSSSLASIPLKRKKLKIND